VLEIRARFWYTGNMSKTIKKINFKIINDCYDKSFLLLQKNSSRYGILAASPQKRATQRNYLSIFARDAGICALGMLASGDKDLIAAAKRSLVTLAKGQALDGQIPNYVKPQEKYVDFWRLGCIDATLWWLIALKFYDAYSGEKVKLEEKFKKQIIKALYWLDCQKHEKDKLLMQNEASDWADIMPRTGKVLYTNALWYHVADLYKLSIKTEIKSNFNNLFFPYDKNALNVPKCDRSTIKAIQKRQPKKYFLSYVNYLFWGDDVDVYGNSLALLFEMGEKKTHNKVLNFILKHKQNQDLPKPVLFNPIKEDSKFWRKYMESHKQNYPYQYHNGGVWPYAACFWAMALLKSGKTKEAWEEMEKIATALSRDNWSFHEWFHAQTGRAHGMRGQSWNAGAFVLAYQYLKKKKKFF